MSEQVSIVLVDDHTIVRNCLKSLIEVLGNYKVIAEFDNGKQFIDGLPSIATPDLVILDLNMPEMSGEQTMVWLRQHRPDLKVLILTLDTDDKTIIELYRIGVRGYLPKSCSANVLKRAIDDTMDTGYYHSDLLRHALIADTGKMPATLSQMSDREMQFLRLICDPEEFTYDKIGAMMGVTKRTVDGYRETLGNKFDIKSKTGLVLFAIKHGLVKL